MFFIWLQVQILLSGDASGDVSGNGPEDEFIAFESSQYVKGSTINEQIISSKYFKFNGCLRP